ncbi:MAG: hypothetical protein QOE35_1510 [Actinomycetota bacterium]
MAAPITLSFALSRAEYAAGARAELGRVVRVAAIAGAGLLAAGVAAKIDLLTAIGTIAVLVAASAWFFPWWQWAIDPSLHMEEQWSIDGDGCTVERRASHHRVGWDFYRELANSGRVYALLGDRGVTDILPKRAFASRAEEDTFVDLVSAHVAVREQAPTTPSRGGWTD